MLNARMFEKALMLNYSLRCGFHFVARLRLDADVIAWRRQGKGYQTCANALLRAAMLEDVSEKAN